MSKYSTEAADFCNALRFFAEHPENIDNFETYLYNNFEYWMRERANAPGAIASEMLFFSTMGVQDND